MAAASDTRKATGAGHVVHGGQPAEGDTPEDPLPKAKP